MKFDDIAIKEIICVTEFASEVKCWRAANRTNHIIGVMLKGSALHTFSDQKFIMEKDSIYFLNQAEDYAVELIEQSLSYSIHFTTYEPIPTKSFCFKTASPQRVVNYIEGIEKQLLLTDTSKNTVLKNFYELCEHFNELLKKEYRPSDMRIAKAKEYIDLHFKEKDCISKAVELCGITRRRFNDIFKAFAGYTPNDYIIERRCALAKALLKANILSVSQIAEQCGFENIYYFSKVFKSKTGVSPSKYTKK